MKVYGQLIRAALEVLGATPSDAVVGRAIWNSASGQMFLGDGTNYRAMLRNDGAIVIGNNGTAANNVRVHRGANGVLQFVAGNDATAEGTLSTALAQLSSRIESYTVGTRPGAGNVGRLIFLTDLQLFQYDNGTIWQPIEASGGAGVVLTEYIANGRAEINTDGWTVYANTSAGVRPDNFGGSPSGNVTWTRSTVNPARGDGHFVLTKDASNRQGEGAYYGFTLREADFSAPLRALAEFKAITGAYADGDVRVYLVSSSDNFATDFNVIEPSPTEVLSSAFWADRIFEAQADASDTAYRLCLHVASVSASAYTLGVESVSFGRPAVGRLTGPVVSDWEPDTSIGATFTNMTVTAFKRRVGNFLEVMVQGTLTGTPAAGPLRVGLPTGLVMDTSKMTDHFTTPYAAPLGQATLLDSGTSNYEAIVSFDTNTSVHLLHKQRTGSDLINRSLTTNTAPFTWASGDKFSAEFRVPIAGWSSNQVVSSDQGTRKINAKYTGHATTSMGSGTTYFIDYATLATDNSASVLGAGNGNATASGTTWRFVAKESGTYIVSAGAQLSGASGFNGTSERILFSVYVGGTYAQELDRIVPPASDPEPYVRGTTTVDVVAGQIIEIGYNQNSGGPLSLQSSVGYVSIYKMSSPQQIAASEWLPPVITRLTSGSGNFVPTVVGGRRPRYMIVTVQGAGGGGSGSGISDTAGNGGTGGTSSFESVSAGGGIGGVFGDNGSTGGNGGSPSVSGATTIISLAGGIGSNPATSYWFTGGTPNANNSGGLGGISPFGSHGGTKTGGHAAGANSGSGGAGAQGQQTANFEAGAGGGAGAHVKVLFPGPLAASYSYAVGAAGTAGSAGTSGSAGGGGGSGVVIIEAYYQ